MRKLLVTCEKLGFSVKYIGIGGKNFGLRKNKKGCKQHIIEFIM